MRQLNNMKKRIPNDSDKILKHGNEQIDQIMLVVVFMIIGVLITGMAVYSKFENERNPPQKMICNNQQHKESR